MNNNAEKKHRHTLTAKQGALCASYLAAIDYPVRRSQYALLSAFLIRPICIVLVGLLLILLFSAPYFIYVPKAYAFNLVDLWQQIQSLWFHTPNQPYNLVIFECVATLGIFYWLWSWLFDVSRVHGQAKRMLIYGLKLSFFFLLMFLLYRVWVIYSDPQVGRKYASLYAFPWLASHSYFEWGRVLDFNVFAAYPSVYAWCQENAQVVSHTLFVAAYASLTLSVLTFLQTAWATYRNRLRPGAALPYLMRGKQAARVLVPEKERRALIDRHIKGANALSHRYI